MNWNAFLDQCKDAGYTGAGDDLGEVKLWLKRQGFDTEVVNDGKTGDQFDIAEMFNGRAGKPMDVSKAAEQAKLDAAVDDRVRAALDEIGDIKGRGRGDKDDVTNKMKHDVKVGRDRLLDDPLWGYKHTGQFISDVITAGKEGDSFITDELGTCQKAALSTYGNEAAGADGGFAVPPEFRNTIMSMVAGEDSILARTDQIPISGNNISVPIEEDEPWNPSGITAYWGGEAGQMTQSKPVLKQTDLKLKKVYALVPLTEELMADSTALAAFVPRKAGEVIDFKVGEAIFRGNGASQPLGFLNSNSLITAAAQGSQLADTLTGVNVLKMWARLYGPYRRNAVWFIQQDVELFLMRLALQGTNDSGTVSPNWGTHLYQPPGGLSATPFGTLLGRPVIVTQHCETIGDVGDICLCAMDQYVTASKGGVDQQSSIHLWFDQDTVALKFRMRLDGHPWRNTTITSRDSTATNTLSAFVTLAARA